MESVHAWILGFCSVILMKVFDPADAGTLLKEKYSNLGKAVVRTRDLWLEGRGLTSSLNHVSQCPKRE